MSLNHSIQQYRESSEEQKNFLEIEAEKKAVSRLEESMQKSPLLKKESERRKERLSAKKPTNIARVRVDASPSNRSRNELISEYAPLIKYIAQKIALRLPPNVELDDLISSGVIGLMDAIEKYDASRDNKFKTYAEVRIRGADRKSVV